MAEQYIFKREQRANFTSIDNAVFDTEKLSLTAIGLVCLIMSKPPTWKVMTEHLVSTIKDATEGSIKRAMTDLANAGYMMRKRERDEDGTVRTATYIADYPKFIDIGTPQQRLQGYGYEGETTDPPKNRGSVKPRVGETEGRLNRGSDNRGVLVKTDLLVKTDEVINDDEKARQFGAVIKAWEGNIGVVAAHISEQLKALIDEVGPLSVIHGIHVATEANVRNFKYVQKCAVNHANGVEKPVPKAAASHRPAQPTTADLFAKYRQKKGFDNERDGEVQPTSISVERSAYQVN
jgi:hypothetical protein